uniref:CUB domain-containing protein n=1 Tax=Steinernema glaseri TaxID=37863 RepID=A0A1I7ZKU5_9BILA
MLICILLLMSSTDGVRSVEPNPCSRNPSILIASDSPKHITSPHQGNKYLPNTDCQFLLRTTNPENRIAINILSSRLEEPLFDNCTDYVTVRDGDHRTSSDIITWCGRRAPAQVIGTKNSLFLAFHSDAFVESQGFNLTYREFPFPGCPPGWVTMEDEDSDDEEENVERWCYWAGGYSGKGLSWAEAQHECAMSQSNLVTFDSLQEREFLREKFAEKAQAFWTGYNSIDDDETFTAIDDTPLPKDFPQFSSKHYTEDCSLVNFAEGEQTYLPADCRKKKPFICARKYGDLIIPAPMKAVRHGLEQASADVTYWVLIIVVLILLLLLCCIAVGHCKERFFGARVEPVEENRFVAQTANNQAAFSTTVSQNPSVTHVNMEAGRAPNHTAANQTRPKSSKPIKGAELNNIPPTVPSHTIEENEQTPVETIKETHAMSEIQPSTSGAHPVGIEEGRSALRNHAETNLEIPQDRTTRVSVEDAMRLETELSLMGSKQASTLTNTEEAKKMMFVRPKMSLLEHSSAISLDDFWKNM